MAGVLSCFFPTTVVFVDDNSLFLNSVIERLSMPGVTFKKFTNPFETLTYINEVADVNRLDYANLAQGGEENTSDWKSILLNVNRLHHEIYSFDRFSRISVVVADHSIPGTTGVELCSNINDHNIQKILLTGIADERVAIDAFNSGHINRFIKKGIDNLEAVIEESISKSIYQYFKIHSDDIFKHLSVCDKTHLKDPIYADFFSGIYSKGNYVEYYMLDVFGGYLFLSSSGEPSMLSVLTEQERSRILKVGVESEEISPEVLAALESREYMLVSHDRFGQLPLISEWKHYLKPALRLNGHQTYYFSLAGPESLDLDFNNIKSFDQFQKYPSSLY